MKVEYNSGHGNVIKETSDNFSSFLISDEKGSFFSQGIQKNNTFYQGFLCRFPEKDEWTMFKFLEYLEVVDKKNEKKESHEVKINLEKKEVEKDKICIKFSGKQSLIISPCSAREKIKLKLFLDPRKIYDFSEFGRKIKIYEEKGIIFAEYENNGYKLFLGIKGYLDFSSSDNWIERNYEFDAKRSGKGKWFVFDGIIIHFDENLAIAQATTKNELMELIENAQTNEGAKDIKLNLSISDNDEKIAFLCSKKAMDELIVDNYGIYAGYYWFFQYWTRDESISLGGLIKEDKKEVVKNVIKRLFTNILEDGRLPNRFPHAELGSADGIGWAVKRFSESINFFDENEKKEIIGKIEISCKRLLEHYSNDDFIINNPKETWMDTTGNTDDVREGAMIEIQALQLNMYKLLKENSKDSNKYQELEENLRNKVRELFFKNNVLCDGIKKKGNTWNQDETQRPNIFLAYYIYPELLEQEQWKQAFDSALEKLWLDWGGLSTIDKNNSLFVSDYTGENDDSYHRGDSWYFVNNIAAIAMHRLDKDKYNEQINKIKQAAIKDILELGILGGASEVSSASEQRAEGTWQQAWSVSTFIELIYELSN